MKRFVFIAPAAILILVIMSVGLTELLTQIEARMSHGK